MWWGMRGAMREVYTCMLVSVAMGGVVWWSMREWRSRRRERKRWTGAEKSEEGDERVGG